MCLTLGVLFEHRLTRILERLSRVPLSLGLPSIL